MTDLGDEPVRCRWCGDSEIYVAYHDREWGVPVTDETMLFEFLILEGMQAGLSWLTILKKRQNFRRAFDGFDYRKIAAYGPGDVERLMADEGIIRNRRKVEAAVKNAGVFLELQEEFGSFARYLWRYVDYRPVRNAWVREEDGPTTTPVAEELSRDLKKRGMNFVGPTIIYAMMQAVGMVNDHVTSCFRYRQCALLAENVRRELQP